MLAIYKREFRAYFHSMTGWLFLAANLFLSGLYFFALNLRYGYRFPSADYGADPYHAHAE